MITGRDLDEIVTLYSATTIDGSYGEPKTTFVSQGDFPARVDILTGTRAMYYQQENTSYPVIIKIRKVEFEIKKIVHNGRTIIPSSVVTINDLGESDTRGRWMTINGAGYAD